MAEVRSLYRPDMRPEDIAAAVAAQIGVAARARGAARPRDLWV